MSYSRLSQGFTYLFILTFHCWVIIFSIQVVGVYYHELCFLFLLNCIIQLIGGRNGYDFKSVRRWTSQKKLGYCLLECDKVSCMPYIVFIYYLFVLFCFVLFCSIGCLLVDFANLLRYLFLSTKKSTGAWQL